MLVALPAKLICYVCCFLYPAYASYKALSIVPSGNPETDAQVERWLMYWAVVGTWTAVEAVIGWTFTWLPFYSLFKTVIFLYLSLPQSEGSSYIYRAHLAPFFNEHETDIDHFLASLRTRASAALAGGLGWLWETARKQLRQLNLVLPEPLHEHDQREQPVPPYPPSMQDPAAGAVSQLYGYFTRYAGQYLPVALTAIQAATASATHPSARGPGPAPRAEQVPESMIMPVPIPTPSPHTYSDPNLRSRAYQHATQPQANNNNNHLNNNSGSGPGSAPSGAAGYSTLGVSSARVGTGHPRSVTSPSTGHLSARSSDDSVHTRSSSSWVEMSSYETIWKEEAMDAASASGSGLGSGWGLNAGPAAQRPSNEKRRSSWFGWGSSDSVPAAPVERSKAE